MGDILALICEIVTRHRFGPWTTIPDPPPRFERAQCRWCRQWYVRPMPLGEWRP